MPSAADVLALSGVTYSTEQVDAALSVVIALAKSYCRADWDELPADVDAAVKTAVLRLLAHPEQLSMSQSMGELSVDFRGGFTAFTIAERIALDRHRVRAI